MNDKPFIRKYWFLPTSASVIIIGVILYLINVEQVGLIIILLGMVFMGLGLVIAKRISTNIDGEDYLL